MHLCILLWTADPAVTSYITRDKLVSYCRLHILHSSLGDTIELQCILTLLSPSVATWVSTVSNPSHIASSITSAPIVLHFMWCIDLLYCISIQRQPILRLTQACKLDKSVTLFGLHYLSNTHTKDTSYDVGSSTYARSVHQSATTSSLFIFRLVSELSLNAEFQFAQLRVITSKYSAYTEWTHGKYHFFIYLAL